MAPEAGKPQIKLAGIAVALEEMFNPLPDTKPEDRKGIVLAVFPPATKGECIYVSNVPEDVVLKLVEQLKHKLEAGKKPKFIKIANGHDA